MSKKIVELIRFISYAPPVWDQFNPITGKAIHATNPKVCVGLQADNCFWYHDGEKLRHCKIYSENLIKCIFEDTPEGIHPEVFAKKKELEDRKKISNKPVIETSTNQPVIESPTDKPTPQKISKKATLQQKFVCRFIVLSNWRTPSRKDSFEPYAETLFGVQVENLLYYLNEVGDIARVYLNKNKTYIVQAFEPDEIPTDTPEPLVKWYMKKSKQIALERCHSIQSAKYHSKS